MLSIPKGNALFEKEMLSVDDVSLLIENLKDEKKFSGYIYIASTVEPKFKGAMLFSQGMFKVAFNLSKKDTVALIKRSALINKIKQAGNVLVSVYIISEPIIDVLSNIHVFKELYSEKTNIKKNEFTVITDEFMDKHVQGIIKIYSRGKENMLVFNDGSIVYDSFADYYGPMLVNQKLAESFVDFINKNGGTIEMIGSEGSLIAEANLAATTALERTRELEVRISEGWGALEGAAVRVDENIFREWGISNKNKDLPLQVESSRAVAKLQVSCQQRLGQAILISKAAAQTFGVNNGDILSVLPMW